eukprot:TRINITY_DN6592_c0_g1_i2.p1 TRINITY_DN6592_c0_g1~~TRINITY_DN6592_c0_g1_i2.p1  ORF type:complete len:720 (-),score=154.23 TRINITY_DN6592_c0_g1_i2:152-2311(-)
MNVGNSVNTAQGSNYRDFLASVQQEFLNKGLIETAKMPDLENAKLGISGKIFLDYILSTIHPDPFIGVSMEALRGCVYNFRDYLKARKVTPMIVFEGLSTYNEERNSVHQTIPATELNQVWQQLQQGQSTGIADTAQKWFESRELLRVLDEMEVEYVIAPYCHLSQLKFFVTYDYVHAVWSEFDMILFVPSQQIILSMDFQTDSFTFLDCKKAIYSLSILADRWNEVPALIGYTNLRSPVAPEFHPGKSFFTSIRELVSKKLRGNEAHIDHAMLSSVHQKFDMLPYADSNMKLETFSKKSYTNKIESISYAFTKEALYCLSFGIVGRELFDALARRTLVLRTPLADSPELNLIVEKKVLNHWEKTLSLAAPVYTKLSGAHKTAPFFFIKGTEKRQIPIKPALLWDKKFKLDYIQKAMTDANETEVSFALVIRLFVDFGKKAEQNPEVEATILENADNFSSHIDFEVYVRILFLNALEIITLNPRNISLTGGALRYVPPKVEESVLILLETMRGEGTLFGLGDDFTPTTPDFSSLTSLSSSLSKENRQKVLLISRLFCVVNPSIRPGPWQHSHDYDLSQMHCIIEAIQSSFRNLYDACILAALPKDSSRFSLVSLLRRNAPFRGTLNIGLGYVIRDMIQSSVTNHPTSIENLLKKYPEFEMMEHYLKRGHLVFDSIVKVFEYFKKKGNANDYPLSLVEQYQQAYNYLHNEFKRIALIKAD